MPRWRATPSIRLVPCLEAKLHRSKSKIGAEMVQKGPVLNPTAEMHFTEGSQGNEGTRLSVGNGPDPKSSIPRCFQWNRCEAEKSASDILEGWQKVAGGRAKRYPRFRQGKKSHPGGVPEPVFYAENLASRGDAGVAAHAPGVSSRTALLNPRLPSGIPPGWPGEACDPSPTQPKTA